MKTHTYLVTVQTDERTRFIQDEEFFRRGLRKATEAIFCFGTASGPLPLVLVQQAPAYFVLSSKAQAQMTVGG
jgi:hypothetical protein